MAVHYRGTARELRALDAYVKLVRSAESVTARLNPPLAAAGLTLSQFGVLEALLHLGPLRHNELAGKLLKSGGNITMVVNNLERRRLVVRRRDRRDRRVIAVHLTPKGRRMVRRLFPRHVANLVAEMGVLGAAEQEKLAALCRRLGLGE